MTSGRSPADATVSFPPDRGQAVPPPGREPTPGGPAAPWLPAARVTAPEQVRGYFHRPELFARIDPLAQRRIIVLQAPGGFGKTLLAELGRRQRERGWTVAWLTLTGDDTPEIFGACLAGAFGRAGLELSVPDGLPRDRLAARHAGHQTALVIRAIEIHAARCLLILARDREIAARLGLSGNGVRWHLRNVYRKTSAAGRDDAVRRARALGFSRDPAGRGRSGAAPPHALGCVGRVDVRLPGAWRASARARMRPVAVGRNAGKGRGFGMIDAWSSADGRPGAFRRPGSSTS